RRPCGRTEPMMPHSHGHPLRFTSRPRRQILPWLVGAAAVGAVALSQAQTPRVTTPAPVKGYSISFFSDEGYQNMLVKGATADLRDPDHVVVTGLVLTLFSGDAAQEVDTVLLSPEAIVQPQPEIVTGPSSVRLIRDDLELTGEDWRYEHAAKRILIHKKARIVFRAPLPDLLK